MRIVVGRGGLALRPSRPQSPLYVMAAAEKTKYRRRAPNVARRAGNRAKRRARKCGYS